MSSALSIFLPDPSATDRLGAQLGAVLRSGDVLLLTGDVGAGKTHLARALITSLLVQPEDVPSPTFTLVQTYDTATGELWHADLYRLSDVSEVEELGLTDAFETAICLIEWPDRLGSTPQDALTITLTPDGEGRLAELSWQRGDWAARLSQEMTDA